jgi:hypothetical protein
MLELENGSTAVNCSPALLLFLAGMPFFIFSERKT